jgi:hypothetical protein
MDDVPADFYSVGFVYNQAMTRWFEFLLLMPLLAAGLLAGCASEYSNPVAADLSDDGTKQSVEILINQAYIPNHITARAGVPLEIRFKREEDRESCAGEVDIPAIGFRKTIPNHGEAEVTLPAQPPGEIPFQCTMGHMKGKIVFQ